MEPEISCKTLFISKYPKEKLADPSFLYAMELPFDLTNFKQISYEFTIKDLSDESKNTFVVDPESPSKSFPTYSIEMRVNKLYLVHGPDHSGIGSFHPGKKHKISNGDAYKLDTHCLVFLVDNGQLFYQSSLYDGKSNMLADSKKAKYNVPFQETAEGRKAKLSHILDSLKNRPQNEIGKDYGFITSSEDGNFYLTPGYNEKTFKLIGRNQEIRLKRNNTVLVENRELNIVFEKLYN